MSDLPEIDLQRVVNKLLLHSSELQNQVVMIETLAEQLRKERDDANAKVATLEAQIRSLKTIDEIPVDTDSKTGKK